MENALSVTNLKTYYDAGGKAVPAVDGVDFDLRRGEILGIVGESGCGKSTIARSVTRLMEKSSAKIVDGEILFRGRDLVKADAKEMNEIRGRQISMIFQDPFACLNPFFTVETQIWEILRRHEGRTRKAAKRRVLELLKMVGIPSPELRLQSFPHQLSGGMQQRVMIAIALACKPDILIADEPTTALDATVQAQILDLICGLKNELGTSILFITHNLGIVAEICDRMMVMYGGRVAEQGVSADVFAKPLHPYTKGLLKAVPTLSGDEEELFTIKGGVPRFTLPVERCRFAERCPDCFQKCRNGEPPLFEAGNRLVRCWLFEEAHA